ncbi:hypothetical protein DFH08DRAFT_821855 [Mycena albidolilacea]|uniref:Uncharacterized protein n=1 Tax=Mycena albidolilacea TaxID=1033008 RepID=A0AAD7ECN3_9AGAR|nr:hypothetical protein DFH08DRAFT_821855 [Mycena albidolilacea]
MALPRGSRNLVPCIVQLSVEWRAFHSQLSQSHSKFEFNVVTDLQLSAKLNQSFLRRTPPVTVPTRKTSVEPATVIRLGEDKDLYIRDLAQKPHEPHAAFDHCAKFPGFNGFVFGPGRAGALVVVVSVVSGANRPYQTGFHWRFIANVDHNHWASALPWPKADIGYWSERRVEDEEHSTSAFFMLQTESYDFQLDDIFKQVTAQIERFLKFVLDGQNMQHSWPHIQDTPAAFFVWEQNHLIQEFCSGSETNSVSGASKATGDRKPARCPALRSNERRSLAKGATAASKIFTSG